MAILITNLGLTMCKGIILVFQTIYYSVLALIIIFASFTCLRLVATC